MNVLARLHRVLEELRSAPTLTVTCSTIEPAVAPIDQDWEDELRGECDDFELTEQIRSCWSEVDGVEIAWNTSTGAGGRICLPTLLKLVRPSFAQDEVALFAQGAPWVIRSDGGPYPASNETERAFLLQLHFLECREAGHWTAFRARRGQPLELWYRRAFGRFERDLSLRADFGTYFDTMLAARGADGWPLLLLDVAATPPELHAQLARHSVPQLRRALEALMLIRSAADEAEALLHRVDALRRALQ